MIRRLFIPLALMLAVLTSGILSWLLLTNPDFLYGGSAQTPQQTVRNEQVDSLNRQVAGMKLTDVLAPVALDAYEAGGYWEADTSHLEQVTAALAQTPSELGGDFDVVGSSGAFTSMSTSPRLILRFADRLPVSLWGQWFKSKDGPPLDFEADQIWLLKEEPQALYLVNQVDETYVRVPLNGWDFASLYQTVTQDVTSWTAMSQVPLAKGKALIRTEAFSLPSQVYTLKKESEANLIGLFFGSDNYSITDSGESGEKKYKTLDLELDVNSDSHVYTARSEAVQNRSSVHRDQIIMDSFTEMKKYGVWTQGLRLTTNNSTNTLYYQRYLDGYPLMSDASPYYLGLQFNLSPKVTRFSGSFLSLRSHIDDKSKASDLDSASGLVSQLHEQGMVTTDLDQIFVAYEWQANMENFQLVTFIPKYYVEYKGRYISLERLKRGELRHNQDASSSDAASSEGAIPQGADTPDEGGQE
ncbi:two-component system activity regulator YycH [Abiotrophia defectiva]|uniref:two-component system activity regulator YycH n=1 Tax=Abiotrophia defectiva TaxID=46125 RepID=UPI0028D3640C|nr:two-component system activity regulator YycH [Abiotrophia defectiva]